MCILILKFKIATFGARALIDLNDSDAVTGNASMIALTNRFLSHSSAL